MYRNLEEHRESKYEAAEGQAAVECECRCKVASEREAEKKPAGNQTGTDLGVYWEHQGEPKA